MPTASTGSSSQPFTFTGEPRDATGLSYLRARYYDPSLGRFTSRDTWAGHSYPSGGLNRFAYVQDNPTSLADPSGFKALALDPGYGVSFVPPPPVQPTPRPIECPTPAEIPSTPPQEPDYDVGECLSGILGFYGFAVAGAALVAGGVVLQGGSIVLFGVTIGGAAPVSAAGVAGGFFLEGAGLAAEGAAFALLYKTCLDQ